METEPNKAPEPTTMAVTIRAPSSTARASHGRGSSLTFGEISRASGGESMMAAIGMWSRVERKRRVHSITLLKGMLQRYVDACDLRRRCEGDGMIRSLLLSSKEKPPASR